MIIVMPQEKISQPATKPQGRILRPRRVTLNPHALQSPRAHVALRGQTLEMIQPGDKIVQE